MTDQPQGVYVKLAAAVAAMGSVSKTKTADTGKYKYKYADLSDVIDAVNQALEEQQLAFMQPIEAHGEYQSIVTVIIDRSTGDAISFPGPSYKIMNDPQANGSAISYGRRYALTTLFGLKTEDDDGAMAHRAATQPGQRTPAEAEVRDIVKKMPAEHREEFQHDFVEEFGSTLTNLPESRHGDALTFAKAWESKGADT